MKKIAPTLTAFVKRNEEGPFLFAGDREEWAEIRAEMKALRACVRALRRWRAAGGGWDVEARRLADGALADPALTGKKIK